jgi:hypothetical protein
LKPDNPIIEPKAIPDHPIPSHPSLRQTGARHEKAVAVLVPRDALMTAAAAILLLATV